MELGIGTLEKRKQFLFFGILIVGFIGLVAASPTIYAIVEPHITINMDPGQTTKPFVINDDTATEVFSVDVDGTITGPTAKTVANGVFNVPRGFYEDVNGVFYGSFGEQGIGILVGDTEPVSFTYSHVIDSSELPTGISEFTTSSLRPFLSAQFQNQDTVSRTLFVKTFVNGVEMFDDSRFISSGQFSPLFHNMDVSVTAGDTIQLKAWASVANQVELKKVLVYTYPQKVTVDSSRVSIIWDDILVFVPILPPSITVTISSPSATLNYFVNDLNDSREVEWGFNNMNLFKGQTLSLVGSTGNLINSNSDILIVPRGLFFGNYQVLP